MENVEFEEKVDLDTLVLPSKPIKLEEIGIDDIKQEPIEERESSKFFLNQITMKEINFN